MDYTPLIAAILQSLPEVAVAIKNLFQQNPQQQGETDAAYIARLIQQSKQLSADTQATTAAVINDTTGTGGTFNVP